jgi:cell division cycle 14
MNWIIPGKMVAFSSPADNERDAYGNKPELYIPLFKKIGVKHIIRLNDCLYDKKKFLLNNIRVTDLYFNDGSTPPQSIVF